MTTIDNHAMPDRTGFVTEFFTRVDAFDFDWAQRRLTESCALVAPGFEYEGAEVVMLWMAGFFSAFPDLRHRPYQITTAADQVAFLVEVTGTHTGELGLPDGAVVAPTGRRLAMVLAEFWTFTGEEVSEYRVIYDGSELAAQLGLSEQAEAH